MSEILLTLVVQLQVNKTPTDMAKIAQKCEASKNANPFFTIYLINWDCLAKDLLFFWIGSLDKKSLKDESFYVFMSTFANHSEAYGIKTGQ